MAVLNLLNKKAFNGASFRLQITKSTPTGVSDAVRTGRGAFSADATGQDVAKFLKTRQITGIEAITYNLPTMERVALKGSGDSWNRGYTPGITWFPPVTLDLWDAELFDLITGTGGFNEFKHTKFDIDLKFQDETTFAKLAQIKWQNCLYQTSNAVANFSSPENKLTAVTFDVQNIDVAGSNILRVFNTVTNIF